MREFTCEGPISSSKNGWFNGSLRPLSFQEEVGSEYLSTVRTGKHMQVQQKVLLGHTAAVVYHLSQLLLTVRAKWLWAFALDLNF